VTRTATTAPHSAADVQATTQETPDTSLPLLPTDRELAQLARALAHPARVAIVRYLLQFGECVCTDLSGVVPLAHSTAMQHLKILKASGLLRSARDGRHVLYCVDGEVLRRFQGLVSGL
jgi:ArsR family transcriptional regulator, arsenate/arsenite/antimonite-responsive transcriptional repressor